MRAPAPSLVAHRSSFTKSKVYLHPTTYKENNVPGWLCIVQLSGSVEYRLAWIPEGMVDAGPDYDTYVLVELDCEATEGTLRYSAEIHTHELSSQSPPLSTPRRRRHPIASPGPSRSGPSTRS